MPRIYEYLVETSKTDTNTVVPSIATVFICPDQVMDKF